MPPPERDLVIIGGGPAGSCAAAIARQRGMRVCVIEKEAFPRFRIGESLLPAGNVVLRATGVWPKLEAAGFIEKFGARFHLPDGSMEKRIDFSKGYVRGMDRTFQVERARFDALLLDHARSLGAEVLTPALVTAVQPEAGSVHTTYRDAEGTTHEIRSRWLIDAGGRDNLYACDNKQAMDPARFPKRVAVYSHFRGLPRAEGKPGGDTIVVRLADGWFWIIPIDADRTSVGLVTTIESMRRAGGTPETVFMQTVASAPRLRELFRTAAPTMGFHVTADYSYFRRDLAFERIVLAGDAGGFFDPIFSSGVYMAMSSAQMAVEMIAGAHVKGRALTPSECRRYTHRVKKHAGTFARLITTFYDNSSISVFLSPRPPFDVERGINSIVAGNARLTWPLWWRFTFFLGVCWLQKRRRLVAPVEMPVAVAPAAET